MTTITEMRRVMREYGKAAARQIILFRRDLADGRV